MEMENGKGDEEERNGRVGLEASVTRPLIGQALFHTPTFIIIIIIFSFFSSFLFLFFTLIPPRSIPPPPHLHPQSSAGLTHRSFPSDQKSRPITLLLQRHSSEGTWGWAFSHDISWSDLQKCDPLHSAVCYSNLKRL